MENSKESAFPKLSSRQSGDGKVSLTYSEEGLTKREYIAIKAMQAQVARGLVNLTEIDNKMGFTNLEFIADSSIAMADALLKKLKG